LNAADTFLEGSQVYDPVALLRREGEVLIVACSGMKRSRRFMLLTPNGQPAWPHEPFGSLSDVAWSLRAHEWHLVAPEPAGENASPAKTLARLLAQRA
jgi:hypothetical protein